MENGNYYGQTPPRVSTVCPPDITKCEQIFPAPLHIHALSIALFPGYTNLQSFITSSWQFLASVVPTKMDWGY